MRDEIQCPACRATMESENFASASIDVCASGCHGLWFDFGEMTRFDSAKKGMGPALTRALARPYDAPAEDRGPLTCPCCEVTMTEVSYELAEWVDIDECPKCGGVFLDAGELSRIRTRGPTTTEAAQARRHRRGKTRIALRREKELRANQNAIAIGMMF